MKRRKGFIELDDYRYIVAKELPLSFAAESVHKTLINLEYVNVDKTLKVIQVSSALTGEGKTSLLINLAYVLKERGKKVLTVDLDLRRPKIHRVFDVANEHGLTEYLAGKITLEQLIRVDDVTGIHYVLSGEKTVAVTNILEATKLKDFFEEIRKEYDYILVDAPPVLAVSDALYISKLSDGILYVIAQDFAKKNDIKEAVQTLKRADTNILGAVLTRVKLKGKSYKYYYNYED